jgi:hypothetical protein
MCCSYSQVINDLFVCLFALALAYEIQRLETFKNQMFLEVSIDWKCQQVYFFYCNNHIWLIYCKKQTLETKPWCLLI